MPGSNKQKNNGYILFLGFCFATLFSFSQHDHDHHEDEITHQHNNEISAAIGIVPLPSEKIVSGGIHLHYIRGVGMKKKFGIGLGFEYIIDAHKHYTVSTVFQYRIYKGLSLAYAPGLLILKEEDNYDLHLAHHVEMAYEFELNQFHIGPVFEVGIEPLGVHYMAGVHLGVDF